MKIRAGGGNPSPALRLERTGIMREKRFTTVHLLFTVLASILLTLALAATALYLFLGKEAATMLWAWNIVETRFVGDYDKDRSIDLALTGMVAGLEDRWSYYVNAEELETLNQRRDNNYVGIGVTIDYSDPRGLLILSVKKDGPADRAGLLPGEVITAVDGFSLAGEAQQEGAQRIQGESGTTVTLTIVGEGGEERQTEVVRTPIQNDSVSSYTLLPSGVGYVALSNFYSGSGSQLNAAVDELLETQILHRPYQKHRGD